MVGYKKKIRKGERKLVMGRERGRCRSQGLGLGKGAMSYEE